MRQLRASGCGPEQPALAWEVAQLVGQPGTLVSRKLPCAQHPVSKCSRCIRVPRPATSIFTWAADGTRKLLCVWGGGVAGLSSVQSILHLKRMNRLIQGSGEQDASLSYPSGYRERAPRASLPGVSSIGPPSDLTAVGRSLETPAPPKHAGLCPPGRSRSENLTADPSSSPAPFTTAPRQFSMATNGDSKASPPTSSLLCS